VDDLLYIAVGVAGAVIATSCATGWTANNTREIAGSWHDGAAQATAWWQAGARLSARALAAVMRAARMAQVLALAVRWPAHGHHRGRRAGVAA
jgi:hypothetical protein